MENHCQLLPEQLIQLKRFVKMINWIWFTMFLNVTILNLLQRFDLIGSEAKAFESTTTSFLDKFPSYLPLTTPFSFFQDENSFATIDSLSSSLSSSSSSSSLSSSSDTSTITITTTKSTIIESTTIAPPPPSPSPTYVIKGNYSRTILKQSDIDAMLKSINSDSDKDSWKNSSTISSSSMMITPTTTIVPVTNTIATIKPSLPFFNLSINKYIPNTLNGKY